jgi:CheY-like chemotaxis protein
LGQEVDKHLEPITRDLFIDYLRDALNHLYNADKLRRSPLAELLGVVNRFESSTTLRKILLEAIDSFRPSPEEPEDSHIWRIFDSLFCCYVQQLSQQIVADQLCISPRQLRREQLNAMEHLADLLWQKYRLGQTPSKEPAKEEEPDTSPVEPSSAPSPLIADLNWLTEAQPAKPTRLSEEVQAALMVFQPMVLKTGVTLHSQVSETMPSLAVHAMAFNQILVSLLELAIHKAGAGTVTISAHKLPVSVELSLQVSAKNPSEEEYPETATSLQIAGELAHISGGRLYVNAPGDPFFIRLVLPALEQYPVLVVDDNEDSLELFKRYSAGSRYGLVCTRDTDPVLELVESIRPRIIVLDIMMPKENGWIVLGRLRQQPLSAEIPIIICTILPQEKLALSLGASAFLKKPVSRQAFLQALDQQFDLLGPESQKSFAHS